MLHQVTERGPWQMTASGRAFYVLDPKPEEVYITDIAAALSRECRYNGQLKDGVGHYSVAQHAFLISLWMQTDGRTPEECYAGLHHDSAEAYTGDIIAQVKAAVPEFAALETRVEEAVFSALNVRMNGRTHDLVKSYDRTAFATEVRDLLAVNRTGLDWNFVEPPREGVTITPYQSNVAQSMFTMRHLELLQSMKEGRHVERYAAATE